MQYFLAVQYILLNISFSCPLPHYPGNTPWFVEHITFSFNLQLFTHADRLSLDLLLLLLLTLLFWKWIFSWCLTNIPDTYNILPKHLLFLPLIIIYSHLRGFVEHQYFPLLQYFSFHWILLNTEILPPHSKFSYTCTCSIVFIFFQKYFSY